MICNESPCRATKPPPPPTVVPISPPTPPAHIPPPLPEVAAGGRKFHTQHLHLYAVCIFIIMFIVLHFFCIHVMILLYWHCDCIIVLYFYLYEIHAFVEASQSTPPAYWPTQLERAIKPFWIWVKSSWLSFILGHSEEKIPIKIKKNIQKNK